MLFLSLFSWKISFFNLKEAVFNLCLAYLNCQHHYSFTLGPLLSKIKVTWTQTLWHQDSKLLSEATKWLIGEQCIQLEEKEMIQVPGRTEQNDMNFDHVMHNDVKFNT
jgi:hypothetical protein